MTVGEKLGFPSIPLVLVGLPAWYELLIVDDNGHARAIAKTPRPPSKTTQLSRAPSASTSFAARRWSLRRCRGIRTGGRPGRGKT
jgi:hypothetical protein